MPARTVWLIVAAMSGVRRPPFWRLVVVTCVAGSLGQLAYVLASGATQAVAWGVTVGGVTAMFALRVRGIGRLTQLVVVGVGLLLAVLIWAAMKGWGAARWVSPVDALVCPLVAYAVGVLLPVKRGAT